MDDGTKKNTPKGTYYLGLSFQMGLFIFIATWGGMKLDDRMGNKPLFVILFSLLSIVISMYYIVSKEWNKKKKDE